VKALILAAGLGTRLGALTADLPKCMLPVGGQPLIERLVRWVRRHGIEEAAINLHHRPAVVVGHLGSGERFGVRITYSFEEDLLGTAGAAKRLDWFLDGPFVVVYGDSFTNVDLSRLVRTHAARRTRGAPHLTMALQHVPNPTACGLADLDARGRVRRFVEKPAPSEVFTDVASAGLLVCEREILDLIPAGRPADFGHDVLPLALEREVPIYGELLRSDEYLLDIGTPAAYEQARLLAAAGCEGEAHTFHKE